MVKKPYIPFLSNRQWSPLGRRRDAPHTGGAGEPTTPAHNNQFAELPKWAARPASNDQPGSASAPSANQSIRASSDESRSRSCIAEASDVLPEIAGTLRQQIDQTDNPVDRERLMMNLSKLMADLPSPVDELYDFVFDGLRQRHQELKNEWKEMLLDVPDMQALSRVEGGLAFHDHIYLDVLRSRIRAIAKLDPERHAEEVQKALDEIALLEPRHTRMLPLITLAEEFENDKLDPGAVTLARLEEIVKALADISVDFRLDFALPGSANIPYQLTSPADVLRLLAAPLSRIRDTGERWKAFELLVGKGVHPEQRFYALGPLLTIAGTFPHDIRNNAESLIVDSLAAVSGPEQNIELTLSHMHRKELPPEQFERLFAAGYARLKSEFDSPPLCDGKASMDEHETLIEARLDDIEGVIAMLERLNKNENDKTGHDARTLEIESMIEKVPREHRDYLFELLREQTGRSNSLPRGLRERAKITFDRLRRSTRMTKTKGEDENPDA